PVRNLHQRRSAALEKPLRTPRPSRVSVPEKELIRGGASFDQQSIFIEGHDPLELTRRCTHEGGQSRSPQSHAGQPGRAGGTAAVDPDDELAGASSARV